MLFVTTSFAEEEPVDWGKGVVYVTGHGVGKAIYKDTDPGQYRLTGIQATRPEDQRQLVSCFKDEPKENFPTPVNKKIVNQPTVVNQNYTDLIIVL